MIARPAPGQPERLFCLINAPADGRHPGVRAQRRSSHANAGYFNCCAGFGLRVDRQASATKATTPADFHRLFPATGGALYGPASHGWRASFSRASSRSAVPGLYLAGGSTHPGPGVPMAATSGRLAAAARHDGLRFDCPVPDGGYVWWYIDALSDDGAHGLTLIAFVGSVFSPYYAWARRRGDREPPESLRTQRRPVWTARFALGDDGTRRRAHRARSLGARHRPERGAVDRRWHDDRPSTKSARRSRGEFAA